jgi:hypothetical protein
MGYGGTPAALPPSRVFNDFKQLADTRPIVNPELRRNDFKHLQEGFPQAIGA